jgi:hypothetical protein
MTQQTDRPSPGSHDRSVPSGSLETSAANLFDAMLAAKDAEERGDRGPLIEFYRTLMASTLLLPVPPEHGEEAKAALASAVNDDEQVEISVMLAREGEAAVSVVFGSIGALAAWAPRNTGNLPLPARIAVANLASTGLPAIMDPAGPVPYRFDAEELVALADGRIPGTDEALYEPTTRRSITVRMPGTDTRDLERSLSAALRGGEVEAAYLVETDDGGTARLLLGLVGSVGASATVDVPDGTDVVWLEEPLLAQVRAVAEPFHRRGRGR